MIRDREAPGSNPGPPTNLAQPTLLYIALNERRTPDVVSGPLGSRKLSGRDLNSTQPMASVQPPDRWVVAAE